MPISPQNIELGLTIKSIDSDLQITVKVNFTVSSKRRKIDRIIISGDNWKEHEELVQGAVLFHIGYLDSTYETMSKILPNTLYTPTTFSNN